MCFGIPVLYTFSSATYGSTSINHNPHHCFNPHHRFLLIQHISSCVTDSASPSNFSSNRASSVKVKSSKLIGLLMVKSSLEM